MGPAPQAKLRLPFVFLCRNCSDGGWNRDGSRCPRLAAHSCFSLEQSSPGPLHTDLSGLMIYQTKTSQVGRGGQTCAGLACVCNFAAVGCCCEALCFGRWGCFLAEQTRLLLSGWKHGTVAEKTQCRGILSHLRHHELVAQGQVH